MEVTSPGKEHSRLPVFLHELSLCLDVPGGFRLLLDIESDYTLTSFPFKNPLTSKKMGRVCKEEKVHITHTEDTLYDPVM